MLLAPALLMPSIISTFVALRGVMPPPQHGRGRHLADITSSHICSSSSSSHSTQLSDPALHA